MLLIRFDIAAMDSLITHLTEDSAETVIEPGILPADNSWFELLPVHRQLLKAAYRQDTYGHVQYAPDHSFEKKTV
jgi:hypothetical protein